MMKFFNIHKPPKYPFIWDYIRISFFIGFKNQK